LPLKQLVRKIAELKLVRLMPIKKQDV